MTKEEIDIAGIVDPTQNPEGGYLKQLWDKYPELGKAELGPGQCTAMSRLTTLKTLNSEREERKNNAYKIAATTEEDVFNSMTQLTEFLNKHDSKEVVIIGGKVISPDKLAKKAVVTVGRLGYDVTIHRPNEALNKRSRPDAIVIGQTDATYADMLRKVKEQIADADHDIRGVRRTKKGELLLEVGKKTDINLLTAHLKRNMGDSSVRTMEGNKGEATIWEDWTQLPLRTR